MSGFKYDGFYPTYQSTTSTNIRKNHSVGVQRYSKGHRFVLLQMPALRIKAVFQSSEFKSLLAEQVLMVCTYQDLILVFTLHFQA